MITKSKVLQRMEGRAQRLGEEIDQMLGAGAPEPGEKPGWIAPLLGLDAAAKAARYRETLAHRRSVFKIAVDQVHLQTCVELRDSPWYRNQLLEQSMGRAQIELLVIEKAWQLLPKDLRPKEDAYPRRMGERKG